MDGSRPCGGVRLDGTEQRASLTGRPGGGGGGKENGPRGAQRAETEGRALEVDGERKGRLRTHAVLERDAAGARTSGDATRWLGRRDTGSVGHPASREAVERLKELHDRVRTAVDEGLAGMRWQMCIPLLALNLRA